MVKKNTELTNKIINDMEQLNGIDFLDICAVVLVRLRKGYTGDKTTQEHINKVLDKVYFLKY